MGVKRSFVVAALLGLLAGVASLSPAQEPPRRAGGFVPGQKRPPGDPAQIARGKTLFDINCRGCHGADLRGGDMGGPNLLRSPAALTDLNGELIVPIIHGSRKNMGMPAIGLSDDDAKATAAYVRSVIETIGRQGTPPSSREPPEHSRRQRRRRQVVFCSEMRQLPFRHRRLAGDRVENFRSQKATDHVGSGRPQWAPRAG